MFSPFSKDFDDFDPELLKWTLKIIPDFDSLTCFDYKKPLTMIYIVTIFMVEMQVGIVPQQTL